MKIKADIEKRSSKNKGKIGPMSLGVQVQGPQNE
jgi:hypothetical protein